MFKNLSKKFSEIIKRISSKGRITKNSIKKTLREVRVALLEADVALVVIKNIINNVKKKCIGMEINNSLTPGQELIKILQKEISLIIEKNDVSIKFLNKKLSIFLMIGLQGSGKTTSVGKLAKLFSEKYKKKVLVVSIDVYRSAAIKQLKIVSSKIKVDFFQSDNSQKPIDISKKAIEYANIKKYDILIIDTAGRLHIDKKLMYEIKKIHQEINPFETIFVLDSMIGQDSINVIKSYYKALPITGIFLTKIDSNTRCGVILSIKYLTNISIKFVGTGEKFDKIEVFNSKKMVSKILGMKNEISLINSIEKKIDQEYLKELDKKIQKGEEFNLNDFLKQIDQINKLGNMKNILNKIPMNVNFKKNVLFEINDNMFKKIKSIIQSMTEKERKNPKIIKISRKKRISMGSGNSIQSINKLLKQFKSMKKIMKKIKNVGIIKMFNTIKKMFG
ncbi:MAG: signal recognition particle protein [Buchnera aphidicola (Periphyllus lyropictus)]|uniref:signal recognition particle protein n=1 Tax=Buchnera aphidicola TaxID=9 RepID=UPI001EC7FC19|nr:signal recognition particle protein [Buchnera aphidicola]NIH16561.1 signal recognition particle protein [Buchnera aphidicola (Periphyllus lyropictus)]USS94454.1 signal recognition particle protein [Buchnera aphidicola (Periphyllus lyropictus)]